MQDRGFQANVRIFLRWDGCHSCGPILKKILKVSVVGNAATVVERFTTLAHTIPGDGGNILGYDIGAALAETTNPSINISYTCVRGMLHYNVFMGDKVAGT
jgi:hypothetical protein